jgi:hypothetical protein
MEASDMILRSQYDASFQCLPDGRSKVGYIHYLANKNDPPEKVRNIFDATSKVLHANAASVVEALTKDDIILSLDLSDVSKPGSYSIPIRVKTLGDYDYELSKDRMNIEVWEVTNG